MEAAPSSPSLAHHQDLVNGPTLGAESTGPDLCQWLRMVPGPAVSCCGKRTLPIILGFPREEGSRQFILSNPHPRLPLYHRPLVWDLETKTPRTPLWQSSCIHATNIY